MSQSTDELLNAALVLSEKDRLKIADALIASLPPNSSTAANANGGADAQQPREESRAEEAAPVVAAEEVRVNRMTMITLANWKPDSPLPPPPDAPKYQWPADVWEFAVRHQVAGYLDAIMDAVRSNFPGAAAFSVYLEGDPEIRDEWHIVYDVRLPGQHFPGPDLDRVQAARKSYYRAKAQVCPAPLSCVFNLHLDFADR